jgi:hypothetical protein
MKAVATQLNEMASMENSLPIEGSAILVEEPMKGVIKEDKAATRSAAVLLTELSLCFNCNTPEI